VSYHVYPTESIEVPFSSVYVYTSGSDTGMLSAVASIHVSAVIAVYNLLLFSSNHCEPIGNGVLVDDVSVKTPLSHIPLL